MNISKHIDLNDSKGRAIGAQIIIENKKTHYDVIIQVTCNGKPFGKQPKAKSIKSVDKIEVEIKKRLTQIVNRTNGHISTTKDRPSGCSKTIEESEDPDSGKYMVICNDHSTCVGVETLSLARSTSTLDFCDDCRDNQGKT